MSIRETGFYWVVDPASVMGATWIVALWIAEDEHWLIPGWDAPCAEGSMQRIDERQLLPPSILERSDVPKAPTAGSVRGESPSR